MTAAALAPALPARASGTEDDAFFYLTDTLGFNAAAACGIMANIRHESNFHPGALNSAGSYGLCQWTGGRRWSLESYCDNNGFDYESLHGQLSFLAYELRNHYPSVYNHLMSVDNSVDGAYSAAYEFCYNFEKPADRSGQSASRGRLASGSYWSRYKIYAYDQWIDTNEGRIYHYTDGTRHYVCPVCGKTFEETIPATHGEKHNPFIDVSADIYYAESVTWAVANGITTGTSSDGPLFSPDNSCTRAQMVTFLWRAAGCPQPESAQSPFADVQDPDAYYYKAVLWAVELGVTTGMTETTFAPDKTVTRAQTVTFLWRYAGRPAAQAENPFVDVDSASYYYAPVLWAVEQEITTGVDASHFAPDNAGTRGQIVTFLYRDLG